MIRIKNLTKDYGGNKGIFDLSFEILNREVFGLIGTSGSGKTTLLQVLMGFAEASSGRCTICAKNCRKQSSLIHTFTGYLPQKIKLPEHQTGLAFLRFLAQMKEVKSLEYALQTAEFFGLDTSKKIRDMSLEEQKELALAGVMLADPKILLLDDPQKNLSERARVCLSEWMLEEKRKGKTMLITAQDFSSVDRICDRIGILRKGAMVELKDSTEFREAARKVFCVGFASEEETIRFVRKEDFDVKSKNGTQLVLALSGGLQPFLQALSKYDVLSLESIPQTLEETFAYLYGGGSNA